MGGEADQPTDVVRKLIAARNESEPAIRDRLLEEALSDRCTFTERERRRVVGRAAISDLIGEELLDPEHWVKLKGSVAPSGDRYVFRWLVSSSMGKPRSELCWLELDGDGRVERLTVHHSVDASPTLGRQVFRWMRDHPAPALAGAAGILYAVLRISMALFYNQFDMTPEEAGFTNDEVLRQSATFIGVMLLYGLMLMAFNWLAIRPHVRIITVAERLKLAQEPGNQRLVQILDGVPFALSLFAVYFFGLLEESTATLISLGALLVSILVVPWLLLLLRPVRRVIVLADESIRRSRSLGLPKTLSAVSTTVAVVLVLSLPLMAYLDADQVKDYGDAKGRLFPWRALPATVESTTGSPLAELSHDCHDLRLLGESESKVFIFDRGEGATVRIPAKDVIVSTSDCD